MNRFPAALKSIPRSRTIATLLSLTDHGTTGAVTSQGPALINFFSDDAVKYHEGLLAIHIKSVGGAGATPTPVGAIKTFTLKYAWADELFSAASAPTILQTCATSIICSLVNAISAKATGTLTIDTAPPDDGDFVLVGGRMYSFLDPFDASFNTNPFSVNEGSTVGEARDNLIYAITHTGTPGLHYSSLITAADPNVTAAVGSGAPGTGVVTITALAPGTAGNALGTTSGGARLSFGAATLTGGDDAATRLYQETAIIHGGRYLYVWYDRDAFAANGKINVTASLIRL